MKLIKDDLQNIGFEEVGKWDVIPNGIKYSIDQQKMGILDINNVLYAFTVGNDVMYIGKTTKSIKNRFVGYVKPGNSQQTNARCHTNIVNLLNCNNKVDILVFAPAIPFQILGFDVNLAAGLEDSLIFKFNPAWNGGKTANDASDLVEFSEETLQSNSIKNPEQVFNGSVCDFKIILSETYYKFGYINPGVIASEVLDEDGSSIKIFLGYRDGFVSSIINRRTNANGSVRIIGNNSQIAKWFQNNFERSDEVNATVIDKNTIFLHNSVHDRN